MFFPLQIWPSVEKTVYLYNILLDFRSRLYLDKIQTTRSSQNIHTCCLRNGPLLTSAWKIQVPLAAGQKNPRGWSQTWSSARPTWAESSQKSRGWSVLQAGEVCSVCRTALCGIGSEPTPPHGLLVLQWDLGKNQEHHTERYYREQNLWLK